MIIKSINLLLISAMAYSQEFIVDRIEDIKFNGNNISITSKREEIVLFINKLVMIKSEDARNKNAYSEFIFSDHVVRILERTYGFDKIKEESSLSGLVYVTDKKNRTYQFLVNRDKIESIKIEKVTQARSVAKVKFEGLKEYYEFEGDSNMVETLVK